MVGVVRKLGKLDLGTTSCLSITAITTGFYDASTTAPTLTYSTRMDANLPYSAIDIGILW
jgi:hypothetical protein